jgi:hypothetical protein
MDSDGLQVAGLRQRDGVSCGPAVALVAAALLDATRRVDPGRFAAEQGQLHAATNRIWPRALGMTPWGMARALRGLRPGQRYRWRFARADRIADVVAAVRGGTPVPMLIGRWIPRHWVLLIAVDRAGVWSCYEPSSGTIQPVPTAALRTRRLAGLGYPSLFGFVLPVSPHAETRCARA